MTVNRTAYSSHYGGSCKYEGYEIKIKNCDGYYVYYLKSTNNGCYSAYCFGNYRIKYEHQTYHID